MARARRKQQRNPEVTERVSDDLRVYRAGLYARLSIYDSGKTDGDSLESQIALMERYVAERPHLQYMKLYQDNGFSGTTFSRPGWEELMRDAAAGTIDCIIVKDLSRLGRNYIIAGDFLEKDCPRMGLRFISINDNYDSASLNASQQLTAALKNIINDFYAKDISRKICTSLSAKRQRGEYIGSYAPYGYQKDPANKNHLIIDPVTAPYVQQIYEWRAAGNGYGTILRRLNEQGIPSPGRYRYEQGIITNNNKKGSALLWSRHVLSDILRNPVYIGTLQQGKTRASLYQGIPAHSAPAEEWDYSYHAHEPILSEELFKKVQEFNRSQSQVYKEHLGNHADLPKETNPYGRKLTCADCGAQMKLYRSIAHDGSCGYYSYLCPVYEERRELACTKKSIRSAAVDNAVLAALRIHTKLFLDSAEVLNRLMRQEPQMRKQQSAKAVCDTLRKEIERKNSLSASLYTDWKSGILTYEEYAFAKEKYGAAVAALKEQLSEAEQRGKISSENRSCIEHWTELLKKYQNPDAVTKELADALISSITVDSSNQISICFRFDDARGMIDAEIERIRKGSA